MLVSSACLRIYKSMNPIFFLPFLTDLLTSRHV